ncbi:Jerky -like protein-like [Trichinella nelsoni]|uniref:Jerky-like protein-like n=1 Tax=Trichinella nelsoni TaxID=6336 RepID=A0A0V0RWD5_9BILA|nr:Jerky -like protein-like [Trichinella nelsoni]
MTEKTASVFKPCKERVTLVCCANATKVPVIYDYQTKAWMTEDIFLHWCDEIFIPHVKEYQKTKRSAKVLFLPPNTYIVAYSASGSNQPDGGDLASQLKSINLKDCCYMIAQVWESISGNTLRLGDDDTPFFETLTDDEILEAVNKDEDKDGDESDMSDEPNERLSQSEAYSSFKFSLKWMEQQKEFSAAQLW